MLGKIQKIMILGLALTLVSVSALAKLPHKVVVAKGGDLSGRTDVIGELAGQFKTHSNKMSSVTMTHFVPLTAPMTDTDGEVGVSFFTQDDVVVSAGVGMKIGF